MRKGPFKNLGFTIVELLVVIVVIGVLAAITFVSYRNITNKVAVASMQSDLSNASKLLKVNQVSGSGFPASLAAAGVKTSGSTTLYYQYNNSVSPQTFCVTARNGNQVYKITENSAPTVGGCLDSGVTADGLVLNMDAGNPASYSGSGSAWLDLTENANGVTLGGAPTYDGSNGGSLVFNGTTDYADFYAPNLSSTTTVEVWAKIGSLTNSMVMGWRLYDVYLSGGSMGYNTAASDVYGISSANVTSLGLLNAWKHYVFEMRSDVAYTNNKIYINGILQTLSQITGSENAGNRTFNSGNGKISGWRNDSNYKMTGSYSVIRVYNRALTQAEITGNFNALRSRYGI